MIKLIILLIIAYLLGSIPFGLWIGKIFFHKNLRNLGSGNTGTTNTFRVLGKNAGLIVLFADLFKGTFAIMLPHIGQINQINPLFFGLAAVIGHTFPIFAHFKGGKAVATSGGVLLGYNPQLFLSMAVIFVLLLFLTSMVSFASLGVALFTVVIVFISPVLNLPIVKKNDPLLEVIILILASFIWIRHKSNLKRIFTKSEPTIPFGLGLFSKKKKA